MSTVADIPKTRKNRRIWAPISVARLMVADFFLMVIETNVSNGRYRVKKY
jgi:hypothetical protein